MAFLPLPLWEAPDLDLLIRDLSSADASMDSLLPMEPALVSNLIVDWPEHLIPPLAHETDDSSPNYASSLSEFLSETDSVGSYEFPEMDLFDFAVLEAPHSCDDSIASSSSTSSSRSRAAAALPRLGARAFSSLGPAPGDSAKRSGPPKRKRCPIMARKNRHERKRRHLVVLERSSQLADTNTKLRDEAVSLAEEVARLKARILRRMKEGMLPSLGQH